VGRGDTTAAAAAAAAAAADDFGRNYFDYSSE